MCGIAGSLDRSGAAAAGVAGMVERLRHRGPGDRRVVAAGGAVLGCARLHVHAPASASGPYATSDGAVTAAVNGEIWNHDDLRRELRAAGHEVPDAPDTSVVAAAYAAWGVAAFSRLRGMFAAAVHDRRDGTTVLARDRFGIKPLHYAPGPPLRFASEAATLRPAGGIDRDALADYLALGVVPAPRTLWRDVRKVPAGTALVVRGGALTPIAFAAPPAVVRDALPDDAELRAALERAVQRHLGGDLACGVFVSGGVDSAVIAALVARRTGGVRTFAATFPGEGRFDESAAARAVAAHVGAVHVEVPVRAADVETLLGALPAHFGDPFADASALPALALARRAAADVGVVLTGTGADELFAGYRRYRVPRIPGAARAAARVAAALLPSSRRTRLGTVGAWAHKAAADPGDHPADVYLERLAGMPRALRERLLGSAAPPPVAAVLRDEFASADRAFADGARAADLRVYLGDDLLPKEDRTAMAASLENRVPYLDDEVADLAGSVTAARQGGRPRDRRTPTTCRRGAKAWLRAAAADLLPRAVLDRPKQGFGVPIGEWLRGPCRRTVDQRLAPRDARVRSHLDGAAVDATVAAHRAGDDALGAAVWALVVLEDALRAAESA